MAPGSAPYPDPLEHRLNAQGTNLIPAVPCKPPLAIRNLFSHPLLRDDKLVLAQKYPELSDQFFPSHRSELFALTTKVP